MLHRRNSPVRSTKSTRSHLDCASSACKHRVSGSLSLPSRGSFHLSLTVLCAIGHQVVFSLGGWSPLLPAGFLVSCGTLVPARSLGLSSTRLLLPLAGLSFPIRLDFEILSAGPQPRSVNQSVWALPTSLAATMGIVITFSSSGYLDVSVHRVPPIRLLIHLIVTYLQYAVFPHSDIHGSKPACGSPWLFAACHVLLRCLVPGHPPYALVRLISLSLLNPETNFSISTRPNFPFESLRFVLAYLYAVACATQLAFLTLLTFG